LLFVSIFVILLIVAFEIEDLASDNRTKCGNSSVVEHLVANEKVAGSNPVFRSIIFAPLAQLDRAFDYESKGREFESLRARQFVVTRKQSSFITGRSSAW
jgi:hypothetical protein